MIELSGWFILPLMPILSILLAFISNIPSTRIRKIVAFIWMLLSLALPLNVSTGSVGGDYALATVIVCYSLKIMELFFCEPFATNIYSLPMKPFLVLLMTYQDSPEFQRWYMAAYNPESKESQRILKEGRAHGLRLWLRAVGYWFLLNIVMAILPASPSEAFENWPRDDWHFWAFTFLSGVGSYLVLALSYSVLMGFYAIVWGIHVKEMFNYPFISHSLRDWWSHRWNLCYKDQYYRIVFTALYGNAEKAAEKRKKWKSAIAALATFVFSGLVQYFTS